VLRHLNQQPVEACPPSAVYRFGKFARRNKAALLTGSLIAIALLVGIAVSTWQAIRATRARDAEAAEHQRANANLSRAIESVEKYLVAVTSDARLEQAGLQELRRDLLAAAVPFYGEFAAQKQSDPDLEWNRGRALRGLTLLHWELGEHDTAMDYFKQARAVFEALSKGHPDEWKYRQSLGAIVNDLGKLLRETEGPVKALAAYQESLAIKQQLARDFPKVAVLQRDEGYQHGSVGIALMEQGKFKESEAELRRSRDALRLLANEKSAELDLRYSYAKTCTNLGFLLYEQRQMRDSENELTEAARVLELLVAEEPLSPMYQRVLAMTYNHLGGIHRDEEHAEQSVAAYQKALSIYERLVERFPTVPNHHSDLGNALSNLAMLKMVQREFATAQELLERAITCQQSALRINPRSPHYRQFLSNHYAILADVYVQAGNYRKAAEFCTKLAAERPDEGEDAYDAGLGLALCAYLAQNDDKLPAAERDELVAKYKQRAIDVLRDGVKRGMTELERLRDHEGFNSLRNEPDFQKLLEELKLPPKPAQTSPPAPICI
jgi:tetratricopeptide (TPR) repeat protein